MTRSPDAPPPAPARRPFRDVALASGLVPAADLDAAETAARLRVRDEASGSAADRQRLLDTATAAVLVEQGKLTQFQSREMLAGRTRFRLGQYTVIDEVGRGGMGQVFKAEHALMGRHVAVKVLPRSKATPESEAAFRREMRILGRLDHENLVRAFDAGYDAMVYYLVTELVPGIDLRLRVRKHGPLDEVAAASVFVQVARGLAFAHAQGLVHRDVKPGNILVMDDGRAKLLDLGLAGSTLQAEAIRLGRVVGTMDYIAPEQIRTPDDVGPSADVYALGCSLYFALSGELPFPGGTRKEKMRRHLVELPTPIQRLAPHLPTALCQVVEAMMAKSVADRIASADEVIQRLAPWTPEQPVPLRHRGVETTLVAAADPDAALESSVGLADRDWSIPDLVIPPELPTARGPAADGVWSIVRESFDVLRTSPPARVALGIFLPALATGIVFTAGFAVVKALDPRGFENLFGGITPLTCGLIAFLLMAALLAAARLGRRHR